MRKSIIFVVALAAFSFAAGGAWAKAIPISGTHSANEIKTACDKAGGEFNTLEGGGWGCSTNNCDGKGGNCHIGCDANGKCNGAVPGKMVPGPGLSGILKGKVAQPAGALQKP